MKMDLSYNKLLNSAKQELLKNESKFLLKNGEYAVPVAYLGEWQEAMDALGMESKIFYSEKDGAYMGETERGPNTVTVPVDISDVKKEIVEAVEDVISKLNKQFEQSKYEGSFELDGRGTDDHPYEIRVFLTENDLSKLIPSSEKESHLEEHRQAAAILKSVAQAHFAESNRNELVRLVASNLNKLSNEMLVKIATSVAMLNTDVKREIYHEAVSIYTELADTDKLSVLSKVATAIQQTEISLKDLHVVDPSTISLLESLQVQVYSTGSEERFVPDVNAYGRMIRAFDVLERTVPINSEISGDIIVNRDPSAPEYWFENNFDGWYAYPAIKIPADAELSEDDQRKISELLKSTTEAIRNKVEKFLSESGNDQHFAAT